jgi:hypothetical protein
VPAKPDARPLLGSAGLTENDVPPELLGRLLERPGVWI